MFKRLLTFTLAASAVALFPGCKNTTQEGANASVQTPIISDSPKISDFAPVPQKTNIKITYYAENGEKLDVIYHIEESSVTVIQPDGKEITLPQALAASGIRYTADEKTVFWSKGTTAQFWLGNKRIFSGKEKE